MRNQGFMHELVVISGRYRGHRVPLGREVLRIGRDRTCEIAVDDEAASRVHSEIVRRGEVFVLRDLQSTNGTFLNDERVTESLLQNGDRIAVGDTVLLLQLDPSLENTLPQVVFSKEQNHVKDSTCVSFSLGDTRFLEIKEGATILDAQRQIALLSEFMVDVAGILHPPALLERALVHFFRAFTADRGLILLLTPEGEPGVQIARLREGITAANEITISRTMVQQLLQKKESFLSVNVSNDQRLAASESLHNMHVYSIMGAPLKLKDKTLGMLYFDTLESGSQFSEQDLRLCTAMTQQLAVCVENTRLYTELLDAAEFTHAMLRSLTSGIAVVDTSGHVLRINRATQDILGKDEIWLVGHALSEFPGLAELDRVVQAAMATGQSEDRCEITIRTAKESISLGVSASVLTDHSGKTIGAVAHFRNLAPIRKLEEQVRRSQHLAALGQMAAGVAHEIRNPLNSIRGFAQLLQEAPDATEAVKHEYTQIILDEVDRMNRIVQDLLDFSQQREVMLEPTHLPKLLADLMRDMRVDATRLQVRLELRECDPAPARVMANGDKLRQVFRNVILNALQACMKEGTVAISLADATLPISDEKGNEKTADGDVPRREVAVAVVDNGCGIDPETMQKIFDPFFTQKDGGTGLGLSISQKFIEHHGGRIEVKSEPGKGSTFTVYLPAI